MAQKHYVDNKKLFAVLVKYLEALNKYKKAKVKRRPPKVPDYIGECLLMIATRLSNKSNFIRYTFREDMISDAMENCFLYMHNFNPKKSQNPFAYFTQIIHYAFIRRIEREKKYSYTKYKYALHKAHQKEDYVSDVNDSFDIKDPTWASYDNVHEFIRAYEQKLARARAARNDDEEIVSFDILEDDSHETEEESTDEVLGLDGERVEPDKLSHTDDDEESE